MKTNRIVLGALAAALSLTAATASHAAITTFSGFDTGASSPGSSSIAAAAAFNGALGPSSLITFESLVAGSDANGLTVAPGVTLSSIGWNIQAGSTCGGALCGDNTTPGGSKFAYSNASNAVLTFNFATPTSAFGAYFGGLQTASNELLFNDGSSQSIFIPTSSSGGFAFVGFNDPGRLISSVTVNVPFDLISVDDVHFTGGGGGVPEPATWAMMLLGFGGLGVAMRARRKQAAATA